MDPATRARFDRELDWVVERLPEQVHELLDEVPLIVEDEPSAAILAEAGLGHADELCGWYAGTPLPNRTVEHGLQMPDVVMIFRRGILAASRDRRGRVTTRALREQIRITILHELAHHHGFDEEELDELGYG
ncbi:MAG: metallopeptidase family protein [Planctomycetota bacterium]